MHDRYHPTYVLAPHDDGTCRQAVLRFGEVLPVEGVGPEINNGNRAEVMARLSDVHKTCSRR